MFITIIFRVVDSLHSYFEFLVHTKSSSVDWTWCRIKVGRKYWPDMINEESSVAWLIKIYEILNSVSTTEN